MGGDLTGGQRRFPPGFLWGAGTAAHQVEGGNTRSDWSAWERDPHTPGADASGAASDHWNRYPEDLALLAGLGLNAYRFSLEWSRIEPEPGCFDQPALDHYRGVADRCRELGLTPLVTFHHFTTPAWVVARGGWLAPETADRFADYCARAASALTGLVDIACTINEPNVLATFGYEIGIFPPGRTEASLSQQAGEVLLDAHRLAVAAIKSALPSARVGLCLAMHEFELLPGAEAALEALRGPAEDRFLDAVRSDDFLGVQAYTRLRVGPEGVQGTADGARTTQIGFEYRPEALEATLRRAHEVTRGVPLIVTENGIPTLDDRERIEFIERALLGVGRCLEDGIAVEGYVYWSALDSFEWILGFWPRYGLIGVDHATQERTVRESARWLGAVARANSLPASGLRPEALR